MFSREPKGELVEQIPEGWRISESINGIISLVKDRPAQILPQELAAVGAAVGRHPKSSNYRVAVKRNRIDVYEQVEPDADEVLGIFTEMGLGFPGMHHRIEELRAEMDRHAQFTPVLRFVLADAEQRTFYTERWCYLGSIDDWIRVGSGGPLKRLARQWIPRLGTDALFEVL